MDINKLEQLTSFLDLNTFRTVNEPEGGSSGKVSKMFMCPCCPDLAFEEGGALLQHLRIHAKEIGGGSENGVPVPNEVTVKVEDETDLKTDPPSSSMESRTKLGNTASVGKPWKCRPCNMNFLKLAYLRSHENVHHRGSTRMNSSVTEIELIGGVPASLSTLETTITYNQGGGGDLKFKILDSVNPVATAEATANAKIAEPILGGVYYKCPYCSDNVFNEGSLLIKHLETHQKQQINSPDLESTTLSPVVIDNDHEESQDSVEIDDDDSRQFAIDSVNSLEASADSPADNSIYDRPEFAYKCTVCPYSTKRGSTFKEHQKIHTNKSRPWVCSKCNGRLKTKSGLTEHLKLHDGVKKSLPVVKKKVPTPELKNPVQPARFTLGSSTVGKGSENSNTTATCIPVPPKEVHQTGGETDAWLSCPFCPSEVFGTASDLIHHLCAHQRQTRNDQHSNTGQDQEGAKYPVSKIIVICCDDKDTQLRQHQPESTSACRSTYNLSDSTDTASTTATGSETGQSSSLGVKAGRRPCPECRKTFTREDSLKIHLRTHNGETPYQCPKCPAKFHRSDYVKRHLKSHK